MYSEHPVHNELLGVASNHYIVPKVSSFSLVGTIPKTTSDSKQLQKSHFILHH